MPISDKITIIIEAIDKASAKIRATVNRINGPLKKVEMASLRTMAVTGKTSDAVVGQNLAMQTVSRRLGVSTQELSDRMKRSNLQYMKGSGFVNTLTGQQMKHGAAIQTLNKALPTFKFELLSVMFAGMLLASVFRTFTDTAMEVFGTTELMKGSMQLMVLEGFDPMQRAAEAFGLWMIDADPRIQGLVGTFGSFLSIIGTITFALGSIGLALAGFRMLFPKLAGSINLAGGSVIGFAKVIVGGIIPAIRMIGKRFAIVAVLLMGFTENWFGLRDAIFQIVGSIIPLILGLGDTIDGIINTIIGVLTLDRTRIEKGWNMLIQGLEQIFFGFVGGILGALAMMLDRIVGFAAGWLQRFIGLIQGALGFVVGVIDDWTGGLLSKFINFGKGIVGAIVDGIKAVGGAIFNVITGLIPEPIRKLLGGGVVGTAGKGLLGLQAGGIVTRPTPALLGERGPEAVIPLNKANKMGQTINFNPVFNVLVSDREDFDRMIRDNNEKMIRDLRRLVQ